MGPPAGPGSLDVHVPDHSDRSDVTERARERERGGHLLHQRHHRGTEAVHKGLTVGMTFDS